MSLDAQSVETQPTPMRKIDILGWIELTTAILLSAVVLFFLAIRATNAGALWRDEAATLQLSQMPISEIFSNFQHEAFPPPFPLLIRTYTDVFGSNDASLRWFGFAVGVLLLAAAWFNSRSFAGRGPLLFLALFGLNATFLTWGTSVRGYGIGCVLLVLTIGFTARSIRNPVIANAIVATIAAIASVQFMTNAVPVVGAIAAAAFLSFAIERQFRRAAIVCVCTVICAISFVPYLHSYLGANWNVVLIYPTNFASLSEKLNSALAEHSAAIFWYAAVAVTIATAIWYWRVQKKSADAQLLFFLVGVVALSIVAYYVFLKILSYATRPWYYLALLCVVAAAI